MNGESVFYCSGLPLRTKCGIIGAGLRRTPDSPGGSSSANAALQRKRRAARGGGLPDGVIGGKDGRNRAAAEGGRARCRMACAAEMTAGTGPPRHGADNTVRRIGAPPVRRIQTWENGMKELLTIFWTFFKIGAFTFGGGYAMLPLLQKDVVEKHGWATDDEILDYFALGQCIPGIIAVNTATFIGHKLRGFWGAVVALLGIIAPSFLIISVIAAFIQNFAELPVVQHAFAGIRIAVCVLILSAVIKMGKNSIRDVPGLLVFLAALVLLILLSPSPVFIVIGAVALGLIFPRKEEQQ